MNIAVDAKCWNSRRGFGRFTRELVAAMAAARGDRRMTLVVDGQTAASAAFPAIKRLLIDDELRAGCSRIGVERAKRHRWSALADKVFSELDRIVASR